MSIVQSVIFDSNKWSILDAANWLLNNGYQVIKIDQPKNFIRFRQVNPKDLKKHGYTEYHNKKLGRSGIELVIAYKPNFENIHNYRK
jgi:hypothetical protein